MKTLIFSTAFALSSVASSVSMAAATCPAEATATYSCTSTPKAGDSEVASNMFDSIAICQHGNKTVMVVEKSGNHDSSEAQVSMRAGGTSYELPLGDVTLSLSVPTGVLSRETSARFIVTNIVHNLSSSSTYTCRR